MDAQEQREKLLAAERYPRMEYTEMDNGFFYFTLDKLSKGDIVTWKDVEYVVRYSWTWLKFKNGFEIYAAEVDPVGAQRF